MSIELLQFTWLDFKSFIHEIYNTAAMRNLYQHSASFVIYIEPNNGGIVPSFCMMFNCRWHSGSKRVMMYRTTESVSVRYNTWAVLEYRTIYFLYTTFNTHVPLFVRGKQESPLSLCIGIIFGVGNMAFYI